MSGIAFPQCKPLVRSNGQWRFTSPMNRTSPALPFKCASFVRAKADEKYMTMAIKNILRLIPAPSLRKMQLVGYSDVCKAGRLFGTRPGKRAWRLSREQPHASLLDVALGKRHEFMDEMHGRCGGIAGPR